MKKTTIEFKDHCPLPDLDGVKKIAEKHITPEPMPPGYCKGCFYSVIRYVGDEITSIRCMRFPPTVINVNHSSFPEVDEDWSCGEFRERIN
jgi:hypothetical protein